METETTTTGFACVVRKLSKTVQANKKRFVELTYIENFINETVKVINQPQACLDQLKKICKSLRAYANEFYVYRLIINGLEKDIRRLEKGTFRATESDYLGIG